MSRLLSISLLFLLLLKRADNGALGQTSNYNFTIYNQEQGLISSTINSIAKDKLGFLWLFSENGICRFDGYQFINVQNQENQEANKAIRIKSFAYNKNTNNFLVVTQDEIALLHSPKTSYITLSKLPHPNTNCSFINHENNFVLQQANEKKIQIYSPVGKMLRTINTSGWPSFKLYKSCINDYLIVIMQQKLQAIHLFTGKQITLFNDLNLDLKSELKILPNPFDKNKLCIWIEGNAYSLELASLRCSKISITQTWQNIVANSIQVMESNSSFYCLSKNDLSIIGPKGEIKKISLPALANTLTLVKGFGENICLQSKENGFYLIDPMLTQFKNIATPQNSKGISISKNVEASFYDGEILWFTSPGNGLIKMEFQKQIFNSFIPLSDENESKTANSIHNSNIRSICYWENNKLLIGSLKGLSIFNLAAKKFEKLSNNTPLVDFKETPISNLLKDPEGDLWVSAWNDLQLAIYDQNTKKLKTVFSKSNSNIIKGTIRSFYFDNKDNLWIGTPDNVLYKCEWKKLKRNGFSPKYIEEYAARNHTIPDLGIVFGFLQVDPTHLFIASENGLIEYEYIKKKFTLVSLPKNLKLPSVNVRCIQKGGKQELWLGTNGQGLIHYNYLTDSCRQFTTRDGLGDNYVYSIQFADPNKIWMGTNNGLSIFDIKNNTFTRFSTKDGLQSAEFNTNASLVTKENLLIFGGINGINCFKPNQLNLTNFTNPLFITSVKNNDQEMDYSSNFIELPYDKNNIIIEFAALGYFRNSEYKYAYQLAGLTNEWINCNAQKEATFIKMPPGNYTFKVKVCDCFGQWSEIESPLHIVVLRPWYLTWWFYTGLLLLLIGIVFSIIKIKINRINHLQEIRNSIAKDLHDEVGANLSNITLFLALIKQKLNQNNTTEVDTLRLFEKINHFTQTSQESMSDIVWMINAKNDQFQNLAIKMKDYANAISEDIPTEISFNINTSLNNIKMDMLYRKNIYLFFKEAMNNALKYAQAKNISIEANLKNKQITLIVCDDGIGFDTTVPPSGNGINNMQKRAEQLNGSMQLESSPNKGTCISLTCPYKEIQN